ncbi:OST-HTH/LOTUS domain-containing protein [Neolewinella agarilytica]|uniref:NYN domain-containing protein n=1 Tax=Neolewinella agarilytica TaxID=478744 RepID=A0A1H9J4R3_9BACT|nr:OST-HTH/LOTUS domain-containing protein [Neolewinella agarilytica]SEQ81813.1 hypothetical protein SAMN05444359_11688 [Neolewinella agarilytica]
MGHLTAVFWNFEPLHDAVMEVEYGPQWYRTMGEGEQPEAIDIKSLIDFCQERGDTVNHSAYANWRWMNNYGTTLQNQEIKLLQIYTEPRGRAQKVSEYIAGDIRATIKANKDIEEVILFGDGSYLMEVGREIKAAGIKLTGLSVASTRKSEWLDLCDEVLEYGSIARLLNNGQSGYGDASASHNELIEALQELSRQYGTDWIPQVKIKPVMLRLLPEFKESDYGYPSFGAYLNDQQQVIERRQFRGMPEPEFRLLSVVSDEVEQESDDSSTASMKLVPFYLRVAAQQGVRMPAPDVMWVGVDIYASFLESNQSFDSFSELDDECLHQLRQDLPKTTLTDAKKIRQVLFKCYLFRPSDDNTIGFQDEIEGLEDIEDRYFKLMLARIGNNIQEPLDYVALSAALTGEEGYADRLEQLHEED